MRLRNFTLVALGLLIVAGAVPARADFIPTLEAINPTPTGFLWTYRVVVADDQRWSASGVVPTAGSNPTDNTGARKDYLTFYDFGGFTGLVQFSDTGFDFVSYPLGATPANVLVADSPAFPNITIFRTEGDIAGPGTFFVAIQSIFGGPGVDGPFTGEGTRQTGPNTGQGVQNIGTSKTPFQFQQTVPEPGTLLLVGGGLLGLGIYRRKRA